MKRILFEDYLKKQLKDSEFKKEWDKSEAHFQVGKLLIQSRIKAKISQRKLAQRAKTTQAVISRIENLTVSPTVNLLQKIAQAFNKKLEIRFA